MLPYWLLGLAALSLAGALVRGAPRPHGPLDNEVWAPVPSPGPYRHWGRFSFKTLIKALTGFNGDSKSRLLTEVTISPDNFLYQDYSSKSPMSPEVLGFPDNSPLQDHGSKSQQSPEAREFSDNSPLQDHGSKTPLPPEVTSAPDTLLSQDRLESPEPSDGSVDDSEDFLDVPTPAPVEDDALNIKPIVKPDKSYRFTHNFRFGYGALPGLP